jgi:hypothetical protein
MKECVNCRAPLRGLQRKYCCRKCKNDFNNQIYQSYLVQQKRGHDRKQKLLKPTRILHEGGSVLLNIY